jgi:hypothetical protein
VSLKEQRQRRVGLSWLSDHRNDIHEPRESGVLKSSAMLLRRHGARYWQKCQCHGIFLAVTTGVGLWGPEMVPDNVRVSMAAGEPRLTSKG